jgi:hypothetical protein
LADFVPPLLEILRNRDSDRHTKLTAINALGDLSMHCSLAFTSMYLVEVLNILDTAARMSVESVTEGDEGNY